jgi:hypothetical protein
MSLNEIEQTAYAYYATGPAKDLNIATRWYPYGELILILDDKISVAVRKFDRKVRGVSRTVAKTFLDTMLEKGAWTTKQNDYGGTMHQFQLDVFRAALRDFAETDPIAKEAAGKGPEFWADRFAALAGA